MAKNIVLVMLYLLSVSLMAQTGFMKSYHIAETGTDNADVIMADTSGYLLQIRTDCNISPTCAGLVKVNLEGIKQWDNLFANPSYLFNPNPTTIKMTDTSYVLSGGLGYFGNAWQVFLWAQGRCSACLLSNTRLSPVTGSTNASDRASNCRGRE